MGKGQNDKDTTDKKLFQNKYRIPSARAVWHDYNCGTYFVTICTAGREHHFGKIIYKHGEPQMLLSEIGKMADECIKKMETLHNDIAVPLHQIMPNHIHLIIVVEASPVCRDDVPHRLQKSSGLSIPTGRGRLSNVVSGLKRAVTKYANENGIFFAWQPRFYDRIIRNQEETNSIARYIEDNLGNWQYDKQPAIWC